MSQLNRFLPYTRWPEELAQQYRAKGYWRGEPLTAMLARQCELAPDAEAILCGERRVSYRELDAASSRLAANLARHGLGWGHRAGAAPQRGRVLSGVLRPAQGRYCAGQRAL